MFLFIFCKASPTSTLVCLNNSKETGEHDCIVLQCTVIRYARLDMKESPAWRTACDDFAFSWSVQPPRLLMGDAGAAAAAAAAASAAAAAAAGDGGGSGDPETAPAPPPPVRVPVRVCMPVCIPAVLRHVVPQPRPQPQLPRPPVAQPSGQHLAQLRQLGRAPLRVCRAE